MYTFPFVIPFFEFSISYNITLFNPNRFPLTSLFIFFCVCAPAPATKSHPILVAGSLRFFSLPKIQMTNL